MPSSYFPPGGSSFNPHSPGPIGDMTPGTVDVTALSLPATGDGFFDSGALGAASGNFSVDFLGNVEANNFLLISTGDGINADGSGQLASAAIAWDIIGNILVNSYGFTGGGPTLLPQTTIAQLEILSPLEGAGLAIAYTDDQAGNLSRALFDTSSGDLVLSFDEAGTAVGDLTNFIVKTPFVLFPTTAPSPIEGLVYYDAASHTLKCYNGTAYKTITMV